MIDPYRADDPVGISPELRILLAGIVLGAASDETFRLIAKVFAWLAGGM
jgi:hypothetical protein